MAEEPTRPHLPYAKKLSPKELAFESNDVSPRIKKANPIPTEEKEKSRSDNVKSQGTGPTGGKSLEEPDDLTPNTKKQIQFDLPPAAAFDDLRSEEDIVCRAEHEGQPIDKEECERQHERRVFLRRARSSKSIKFELGDDFKNEEKMAKERDQFAFLAHEVNYSLTVYLEFFLHHILFFTTGPIYLLFMIWFRKTRNIVRNLQFLSLNSMLFMQIMVFVNFGMVVMMIMMAEGEPLTGYTSLTVAIASIFMRSSNIAAKYATFPKILLKKYRNIVLGIKEFKSDFLLGSWRLQEPEKIEEETIYAIRRNTVDETTFQMTFFEKIADVIEEDMGRMLDQIENKGIKTEFKKAVKLGGSREKLYYDGKYVFWALVRHFNSTSFRFWKLNKWIGLMSVIWACIPLLAKLRMGYPISSNFMDTMAFYMNIFTSFMVFFQTSSFFSMAKLDMRRSVYLMRQLSHMISTQKFSNEVRKIIPTMNFMEEGTLLSWKIMRRLTLDYGKQYFYRHEIYLPAMFLSGVLLYFTIFALQVMNARSPGLIPESLNVLELQLTLGMMSVILFFMTFSLLLDFAKVNDFFEIHTLKLYHIRQTINDLRKYKEFYFKDVFPGGHLETMKNVSVKEIFPDPSQSHLHSRLAWDIRTTVGEEYLKDHLSGFLDSSIQAIDEMIAEISIDQKYQSIEVLGFVISKNFVFNLFVVLLSITITFYELFIQGMED